MWKMLCNRSKHRNKRTEKNNNKNTKEQTILYVLNKGKLSKFIKPMTQNFNGLYCKTCFIVFALVHHLDGDIAILASEKKLKFTSHPTRLGAAADGAIATNSVRQQSKVELCPPHLVRTLEGGVKNPKQMSDMSKSGDTKVCQYSLLHTRFLESQKIEN